MSNKEKSSNFFSEWLEKIQQESWQLELIISGLAIYGLFNVKDYLNNSGFDIYNGVSEFSDILQAIGLFALSLGVSIFIANLLFHIGVRALWIGAQLLCDFYIHPYNQTQGLLCFFQLDSLSLGRHHIGVRKEKNSIETRDSLMILEYAVPFIYEGKK